MVKILRYNNFTLLVLRHICSILNRKNNILSYAYYDASYFVLVKLLMHLCKTNTLQA